MTEFEEKIKWDIDCAHDTTVEEETIPCSFYGTRITKKTITSQSVGYSLIQDYVWVEAYNTANILGGYACTEINESVVKI